MTWRKDSALTDGHDVGVDLVGGYYDAGDNVKYGFPMAFTTTMLSWSAIEFGGLMGKQQQHALEAVKWGTDYLLKATNDPNTMYVGVGDPNADHACWERPEDMETPRTVYSIVTQRPGSEVSAETAAALAAASIAFQKSNKKYSDRLLDRAVRVFKFADTHRGSYNTSASGQCPFYCDYSGYQDELIWGASWLYKATKNDSYMQYILGNIDWLKPNIPAVFGQFGWDNKHAGIYVLLYKDILDAKDERFQPYKTINNDVACTILPESPSKTVTYSPGESDQANIQNTAALSFILVALSQCLKSNVKCGNSVNVPPSRLIQVAKSQVDYILGENPVRMSFMVGYGENYPKRIHHRGSSLPSVASHGKKIGCDEGRAYANSPNPNPNLLTGAIVGGPDKYDRYNDTRDWKNTESEPATYVNAFMGLSVGLKLGSTFAS